MKKTELKNLLKPLIKECVKEAILEEGILSSVISEVARGLSHKAPIPATPVKADPVKTRLQKNAFTNQQATKLKEHKQKLMSAIGNGAYNGVDLFEGTTPAPAEMSAQQQAGSLSSQAPGDPGVDISNLFGSVGQHWNAHMNEMAEKD